MDQSRTTLELYVREREQRHAQHEEKLKQLDGKSPDAHDREVLRTLREEMTAFDADIKELSDQLDADEKAKEASKAVRRAVAGAGGVEAEDEGVVYKTMAAYARDVILTRESRVCGQIAAQFGDPQGVASAKQRLDLLKRTPANTLSSNVAGLIPDQHIAQIFQVIDSSRPLVAAAVRTTLERGTLTYPEVTTRPVVAVQSAEKTEAGNTGMVIDMVTKTASTYLGGGDLSWQAINWSTPDALDLWFRLTAADYALKTETDAATVVSASAFLNNISSTIAGTPTFAQLMTAIGAGGADVYANSGRMANAVIMAPDRYWYAIGLTSDADLTFGQSASLQINGETQTLRVIVSRGLNAGEIIVGDMSGLLVAETAGAPVELRVVEPAIGGVEVGLIGAFEAAVVDDGAFALITTAS